MLKTLMTLAASNNKSARSGSVGEDAQLKNRTVLYPDETVDLPEWGIAGLPAMILGAAPQTCLFVSDLSTDSTADENNDSDDSDESSEVKTADIASFSLTLKCPPDAQSSLKSRTIVWQLAAPVSGYRDIQTSANSASVRAPVIKTRMVLHGIDRDVDIGLLEMAGLEQPLLIGQDTLGDKFLIRPDRAKTDKTPKSPAVDLNPPPSQNTPKTAPADKSPAQSAEDAKPTDATQPTVTSDETDQTTQPDTSSPTDDKPNAADTSENEQTATTPSSSPDETKDSNETAAQTGAVTTPAPAESDAQPSVNTSDQPPPADTASNQATAPDATTPAAEATTTETTQPPANTESANPEARPETAPAT
ncbi:hypothetical protein ACQ0MK_04095 [Thalassospira lucentensis]|uniref:hypothetical protein n=1 Tax=Thalassospira lucentensis TaxID=168935 RepID=UPI003D2ED88B